MHESSMLRMKCFVENYCILDSKSEKKKVLDIGSCDIIGSYKSLFPSEHFEYVGLDMTEGLNVDIVPKDPYNWDIIEDESFDYVISGQAFEHIEFPWLTIKEIARVLKRDGIICIIAPNGLGEHRFPVDCWRFYSDGMAALAKWASLEIIEVSVGGVPDMTADLNYDFYWNDACLIACKSLEIKESYKRKAFPFERRYDLQTGLKYQMDVVNKWVSHRDQYNYYIGSFVIRNGFKSVYIIGDNGISIFVSDILKRINSVSFNIISDMDFLDLPIDQDTLYLITSEDEHQIIYWKRNKYSGKRQVIYYMDELFGKEEIFQKICILRNRIEVCPDVYIYGAGKNGRTIEKILIQNNINFTGFVVSDNMMNKNEGFVGKIFKLSDVSVESAIIVSPEDSVEIYKTLEKQKFKNIVDGRRLICDLEEIERTFSRR